MWLNGSGTKNWSQLFLKTIFRREEMDALVDLAFKGIGELAEIQKTILGPTMEEVRDVLARGRRRQAPAKSEKDLWGRP